MASLDSDQITPILKKNTITKRYFKGWYPRDKIPNKNTLRYPASLLINLDKENQKGSHWVGIFAEGLKKTIYYFDSYAMEPVKEVKNFLNEFPKIIRNKFPYQSIYSNVCGHYVIVFIYFLSLSFSFDYFIRQLDQSRNTDLFVNTIVKKMVQ